MESNSAMIDDLQTLCTATMRRHCSATDTDAQVAFAEDCGGSPCRSLPPPIIDPRVVDELFDSLKMKDRPRLQYESVQTLVDIMERLAPEHRQAVQEVAIPVLMKLFRSDDECRRANAEKLVREIVSSDSEDRQNLVLGPIVRCLMGDNDSENLLEPTADVRRILQIEPDPPARKVVESGILPRFVEFLRRDDDPDHQYEAVFVVATLAEEHKDAVVDAGATPALIRLLSSPHSRIQVQATWGIAHLTEDNPVERNRVLQGGAMEPLVALVLHPDCRIDVRRNAAWVLSNLCRGEPRPTFERVRPALPALAQLINGEDDCIVSDACWALCYLTGRTDRKIQEVIDIGACPRLVELIRHPKPKVQDPAIRTVGNMFTGSPQQVQAILNQNPLPSLHELLRVSPHLCIQEAACWSVANIVWGGIQAAVDCGIVPTLVELLDSSVLEIRIETARAIVNFTGKGTVDQIQVLVAAGCIPRLCRVLTVDVAESQVVSYSLTGLSNVLRAGFLLQQRVVGGTRFGPATNPMALRFKARQRTKLAELRRMHPDDAIRKQCRDLLEIYFRIGEDDDNDDDEGDAGAAADGAAAAVGDGGDGDVVAGEPPRQRPRLV